MSKKNEMKKFCFFFIFFFLFGNIGWGYISVSVSPVSFQTSKMIDSFEITMINHGDESIRISFYISDTANKSKVLYIHFISGNTYFLNSGESITVPVEFSFAQSTSYLDNNFPIICEISSLKKITGSFVPKFRMLFYVSMRSNQLSNSFSIAPPYG